VKINFRNLSLAAAVFSVLRLSTGCSEATLLGKDLIPGGDFVNASDTTLNNLIAHNILRFDSAVFTGRGNFGSVLGSITNDPLVGKSSGLVYMQVGMANSAFTFQGSGQTLDSVVLSVGYSGYFGDSLLPQTFRVYRMSEPDFKIDSNYRYNQALSYNAGELLGTATINAKGLQDSVSVYGTKEGPQLRIKLDPAVGTSLLQQTSTGNFATDSSFHVYFKGLAIVPDTVTATNSTMLYMALNAVETKMTVFYKNTENDSLRAVFPFYSYTGYNAHANYFTRNYQGSEAANYINTNRPEGDSLLFLQEAPGLYTKFTIPGLDQFPRSVINKAELVITQVTRGPIDKNDIYTVPDYLFVRQYVSGDTTKPIIDYGNPNSPNQPYFGGQKTVITNFGGTQVVQYTFNVARYVQLLLAGKDINNGFKLEAVSNGRNIDLHRVKVGGGDLSTYNMKLRVIYTKL
jgi:hypothetical protein